MHKLYKNSKAKCTGSAVLFCDGEVIQWNSLLQSVQQQGVGSALRHIRGQLPWPRVDKHLQWPQAKDVSNKLFHLVICQQNSLYFWSEFMSEERFGTQCRQKKSRIHKQIYIVNRGENILSNPSAPSEYGAFYYYSKCFSDMFLLPSSFSAWNPFKVDLWVSVGQMCLLKC